MTHPLDNFATFSNISSLSEYETLNPDGTCSYEVITSGDKSCWFTNDFRRQCDDGRFDLMGKTAQECLEQGFTHQSSFFLGRGESRALVAHWAENFITLERFGPKLSGTKRCVNPSLRILC